jgi:hypothetical protein
MFCNEHESTFPVRFVSFQRRSPEHIGVMSSDVSELGGGSSSAAVTPGSKGSKDSTPSSSAVAEVKTVWDFEKMEKRGGPDAFSKSWYCGWCGLSLKGWNATKALNHISKAPGNNDVKACSGAIPKNTLAFFQSFRFQKLGAATLKRQHKDAFAEKVSENQHSIAVMFQSNRNRASKSGAAAVIDMTGDGGEGVALANSTKLTSAIAEFVYSKGLSFSATEGEHFQQILKLSRLVSNSYRPPSRKVLANELLELSYQSRLNKYMVDLEVDAEVYGISLFGDGATVHGMPLMNILASGVHEPSAVLAIIDCKFLFLFFCC